MRLTEPTPKWVWHYCCSHSLSKITKSDVLRPHPGGIQKEATRLAGMLVESMPVVWLTDLDVQNEDDAFTLGLGHDTEFITCDRVQYRFRVSGRLATWWPTWADHAEETGELKPYYRKLLELDRTPERWFVSDQPIRSPRLDERYGKRRHP